MSRLNVRRLTAGLLLAALLGLAAPVAAAPAGRPLPTVALGASAWIDHVLEWLGSFWLSEGREGQRAANPQGGSRAKERAPDQSTEAKTSIVIDPNGGK